MYDRKATDERSRWFCCTTCGFEFLFSGAATFEEIRQALEDHACYPAMSLRSVRPLASALVHTLLIFSLVCCLDRWQQAAAQASVFADGTIHAAATVGLRGNTRIERVIAVPASEQSERVENH